MTTEDMREELSGGIDTAADLQKKPRRSAGAELIIPVSGSVFALYYFTTIWDSPWTAQVSAFFIGSVLMLTSAIVAIRIIRALRRGETHFNFDRLIEPRDFLPKRLGLFALTIAYIVVIQYAGFTLTTFAFLLLAMGLLNSWNRMRLITILSAVIAICGWLLFVFAFEVRFPAGPFETMMKGIL
jgi:hypothetical protein